MSDGKSVEVGLLGTDGFVGTPLVAGYSQELIPAVMKLDIGRRYFQTFGHMQIHDDYLRLEFAR
jgi:hypothetical protein